MKSIRKKYFWIILFLLAAGTGYYLYSSANSESKEVRYVTARAQKGPMATSVSASGSIIVDQLVNVDPRISGTVYGLAVSVGDSVKKGQLLFMIDNDELSIDADRAYSSYLQAMASFLLAFAFSKEAKNVYEDSNSEEKKITKKKLDAAEISVEVAERNVKTSWKAHQNALKNASETRAVSTIDGTVIEINIENGDSLNDSSSGNGDKTPIIIGDLGTVKAEVQVNEVDISNVKVGQTATVAIDAIDGLSLTGKVEKIDALGTTNSGVVTYGIVISFDSLDDRIRPGMNVSAEIITNSKEDAVIIPSSAIKTRNGKNYVQVMNGQIPEDRQIEIGITNNTRTEIVSGVNEGDNIVTRAVDSHKSSNANDSGDEKSDLQKSNDRNGPRGFPGRDMMIRM